MAVAWPFAFHALNGVRHLVFDLGYGFANRTVIKGEYYIWGASVVTASYLAFFL